MCIHIIFMRLYSSHQQIYAMLYTHLCPRIDRHLYCNVNVLQAHVHLARPYYAPNTLIFTLLMNFAFLRDSLRATRPPICNAHESIFRSTLNAGQLQPVNTA